MSFKANLNRIDFFRIVVFICSSEKNMWDNSDQNMFICLYRLDKTKKEIRKNITTKIQWLQSIFSMVIKTDCIALHSWVFFFFCNNSKYNENRSFENKINVYLHLSVTLSIYKFIFRTSWGTRTFFFFVEDQS